MGAQDARCGWTTGSAAADRLEGLHAILLCAARRGCPRCVDCSERALELVLEATGKSDRLPAHPDPRVKPEGDGDRKAIRPQRDEL